MVTDFGAPATLLGCCRVMNETPFLALIAPLADASIIAAEDAGHGGDYPSFFYHQATLAASSARSALWPR
jgi:hypothetical protein